METLDIIKDILNDKLDIEPEKVTEETTFEDLEIDAHRGEQPLYPVVFSVE